MAELQSVLVVDDDEDILEVTKLALEGVGGLVVQMYSSGQAALDALEGFTPDLILLDVQMPDMNGAAFVTALRQRPGRAQPPVVFITAGGQAQAPLCDAQEGVLGVISKPFDPMALADRLKQIMDPHGPTPG